MEDITFFATTPSGMADLLAAELRTFGATEVSENRAGALFSGSIEVAYRACLWSRLANRILMPVSSFHAPSPEALYDGVRAIDWSQHLTATQTIAVDTNVTSSKITHSHYAALKIKDAIVDGFAARDGTRPSVDVDHPDIRINCYLQRDQAEIYIDLSGNSLHQRNYRLGAGQAPLKENLAAALLYRARWPEMAADHGAFLDLMCGSGTLVIEAALMAADMAPGLTRSFYGFLGWRQHNRMIWDRLISEARFRRDKGLPNLPPLLGFDHDRRVLEQARENAERAGVASKVSFAYQDLFQFKHDFPAHGLMVTNPPYGRRLLETGELPKLYDALGKVMKRDLRGWKAAVFTEDASLGKHIGIRADKLHTLFNGAIACKLIHFKIEESQFYRDDRLPRRLPMEDLSEQARGFRNRLEKNLKAMTRWAARESVSCYRVYDADLPDYSAAIDIYGSADDPRERWICIQEYAAPVTIDERRAKIRTREMVTVTQLLFDIDDDHLFYQTRARQKGEAQYERRNDVGEFHEVREGAARLRVNFIDYLDTGLFLDHRPIRMRLNREAKGKRFLNLFAYTGAATVQAALGGASQTTTVDMSRTYLEWATANLKRNGLLGKQHELIQADCLQWLNQARKASFDLIFLDPPTFSNSKRMEDVFDIQKDHVDLIKRTAALLDINGILYFSTNLRHFKLDTALSEQFTIRNISAETIPFDFKRRQNIHHCFLISSKVAQHP